MLKLSDLVLDPEFQSLLPPGSDAERAELHANIVADQRFTDPLIVWLNHGIVVDGQTRFDIWQNELACSDDIQPEIVEKSFESRDHVKAWMIRHQAGRRNWNASQRAMMAAELATLPVGANQHGGKEGSGIPLPSAAKEMNVSVDSVKQARKVKADGSSSLNAAVTNGSVSVNDAAHIVDLPKSEQTKAVNAVKAGKAKTVTQAAKPKPSTTIDPEAARVEAITGKPPKPSQFVPEEFDPEMAPDVAAEVPTNVPKHLTDVAASCQAFAGLVTEIGRISGKVEKLTQGPGGGKLAKWWTDIDRCLSQVQTYLKCYRFWAACPECKITDKHHKAAKDCKLCGGHGWIAKTNGLSDEHKAWLKERGVKV